MRLGRRGPELDAAPGERLTRDPSDVALRYRSDNFHRVPTCDVGKLALVNFSATERVTKVVEVTDHHSREEEVELATRRRPDPEAMAHPRGDEDE